MNLQTQLELFDEYTAKMRSLIQSKGNDYAGVDPISTDRLSNFKEAGALAGISPKQQALSLIATKVARLGSLFNSGGKPNHEAIEDSAVDGSLYFLLLAMLIAEEEKATEVWAPVEEYNMLRGISKDPVPDFIETHDGEGSLARVRRNY